MPTPDTLASIGVVRIADVAPAIGIDGDLWYSPLNGQLHVSESGAWLPVGSGGVASMPEVSVGANQPTGSEVVWINTSDPAFTYVHYKISGSWIVANDGGRY